MLNIDIQKTADAATEQDVLDFESYATVNLTPSYREFLLTYNGGIPYPNEFTYSRSGLQDSSSVQFFASVSKTDPYSLYYHYDTFHGRVPAGTIPIARDPAGNLILLSLRSTDDGTIYFWDHELEASDGESPRADNIFLIASSFTHFLERLTTDL